MTDTLVLGIELGLSGIRAAVMDERGKVIAASDRYPVPTKTGFGRAEQEPNDWLGRVALAGCDALAAIDPRCIEAVGVSALGPAPVLVSEDLQPVTPALLFSLDTRAEEQRCKIAARLGLTGDRLNHDHAIPKLLWWRDSEPSRWERAVWALDATGFIVSHLTGKPTMDTITALDYLLDGFQCPIAVPQPQDPLSAAGQLTGAWAELLGLRQGVPVSVGTYDSYADAAATGTLSVGDACVLFGSTLIIGVVNATAPNDLHGLVASPHLGEGVLVGGWTSNGGSALSWARKLIGAEETFDDALEASIGNLSPVEAGLVFLPYLSGARSPVHDPSARGLLLGLSAETKKEHVYRAVVDGVVLSVRDHADRLAMINVSPLGWRAGGGGSRNRALVQSTSDALRAPIEIVEDGSLPIGPCRLALRTIGHLPRVAVSAALEPNEHRSEQYDRIYGVYRQLYKALSDQMHMLTNISRSDGDP
jgi:xylulokinase